MILKNWFRFGVQSIEFYFVVNDKYNGVNADANQSIAEIVEITLY